jgi:hypothetical protein
LCCLTLLGLVACQKEAPVTLEMLDPREQLVRLSMDLRGYRPSGEELDAIEAHPELYDQYVDRYVSSPEFLDRMMEIFNLAFQTRTGDRYYNAEDLGLEGIDEQAVARAVGDEPLQLIRHIIENDLPYSEVVTAPYTMTNEVLSAWWGINYPEGSQGWIASDYTDGRPQSGVLSQNTFWHKYPSMGGNANRHRANAISRVLLCDDFLSRPIVLDRLAIDKLTQDPENAIRTTDTCQSCHSSLDPLAGNLFGFFREDPDEDEFGDGRIYRPENELAWKHYSGRAPAWYGTPTSGLQELGEQIAGDPRFVDCAVQTVFEGLTQRHKTDEDWKELQGYRATFELAGLNIRSLVKDIVRSETYRARAVHGDTALEQRLTTIKLATPAQLASAMERITGYAWTFGGSSLADNARGLGVLAGGIDSRTVRNPADSPSLGMALVQERLAQSAAHAVVTHDFDSERADAPRLLTLVSEADRPETSRAAFEDQMRALYDVALGLKLDSAATEPAELIELWSNVYSVSASSKTAWTAVVSAVLCDPRIVLY